MHIVHAIEHKEWPVAISFSAGDEPEIINNEKESSEVITITTDHGVTRSIGSNVGTTGVNVGVGVGVSVGGVNSSNINSNVLTSSKKRKRHIAIDVETERGNFSMKTKKENL